MKKKIKYLILAIFLFLIGFGNASAMEINEADIAPNTYVIGTHMFTEEIAVSTSHIMLAAKSISSNDLADMIIYYKKPRGGWINGATGETIEVPNSFEINYADLTWNIETPILRNLNENKEQKYDSYENGIYKYSLWFNNEDYSYLDEELGLYVSDVKGFEYLEKDGEEYTLIRSVEYDPNMGAATLLEVEAGTTKTFVIRLYTLDSKGNKVYSDYSNEIVLDNFYLPTPTLSTYGGTWDNWTASTATNIVSEGTYAKEGSMDNIDGVELYEIIDDDYTLIETSTNGSFYPIDVEFGTSRTFVARVYALDNEGNNVYSDYSNELVLDNYYLPAPTLSTYGGTSEDGITSTATGITAQGAYANEGSMDNIDGVELYEIINDEYNLIETSTNGNFSPIDVEFGTSRTLVTRVYALDNEGNKVYSDFSNEIVIDHSNE